MTELLSRCLQSNYNLFCFHLKEYIFSLISITTSAPLTSFLTQQEFSNLQEPFKEAKSLQLEYLITWSTSTNISESLSLFPPPPRDKLSLSLSSTS